MYPSRSGMVRSLQSLTPSRTLSAVYDRICRHFRDDPGAMFTIDPSI
jgi:hypothetical protein